MLPKYYLCLTDLVSIRAGRILTYLTRVHSYTPGRVETAADYTVRPTGGAYNLFLISRASFLAHSPYAHLDGHHQESMHAKVKVLKPSPQTFLAGMHAQLRPIGGRSEPDFSLYNDKECESQLLLVHAHGPDRALGLCTNPRSQESKPASKEKVVCLTRGGRPVGEYALCNAAPPKAAWRRPLWPCRG